MAFTATPVDGPNVGSTVQVVRLPIGDRFMSFFHVDEVTTTGAEVDLTAFGVGFIDAALAINEQAINVAHIQKNSKTLSQTQDDPGWLFIDSSAGTDDYLILVIYKL